MPVQRRSVDLSAYPDLVVICLGMRVNALTGPVTGEEPAEVIPEADLS
jgi:hypothetical protein